MKIQNIGHAAMQFGGTGICFYDGPNNPKNTTLALSDTI
jgi:hypothetical protein